MKFQKYFINKYTYFYTDEQLLQFKQQESNEVQKHKKTFKTNRL